MPSQTLAPAAIHRVLALQIQWALVHGESALHTIPDLRRKPLFGRTDLLRPQTRGGSGEAGRCGAKEPGVAAFVKRTLDDAFYPRVEAPLCRVGG